MFALWCGIRLQNCSICGPAFAPGLRWASPELSRRVEKVVAYPPLSEMDENQRWEFHEALLEADGFEHLPGRWKAATVEAEQNRPKLRVVRSD
jgi:hypothetical protein